jgi:hypothetical protein
VGFWFYVRAMEATSALEARTQSITDGCAEKRIAELRSKVDSRADQTVVIVAAMVSLMEGSVAEWIVMGHR